METDEKFYQKKWFTVLLLILISPIGIILLWMNKGFSKKTKKILTIVFSVWFIVMVIVSQPTEEEKKEEQAKQEQLEKEKEEKKQKEIDEKKAEQERAEQEEKEKAKEKEIEDERRANRSIAEAIQEDSNNVDEATLDDGELTLRFEPGTLWSESSFMGVVHDMFKDVNKAFEDKEVDSVLVMIDAIMTDEKGNEDLKSVVTYRYTRSDFEELNYDNFIDMSLAEEWRILNEADSYFIHPGIRKNLKDKYIQNLR